MPKFTRKRLLLAGAALGVVALGAGLLLALTGPGSGITKTNFERIQKGMTEREVIRLLGTTAEATTYVHAPTVRLAVQFPPDYIDPVPPKGGCLKQWLGDEGSIGVTFDAQGRAHETLFLEVKWLEQPSYLERLWRRLRR